MKVWVSDHLDHSIRNLTRTRASPSDPVAQVVSIFGSHFSFFQMLDFALASPLPRLLGFTGRLL